VDPQAAGAPASSTAAAKPNTGLEIALPDGRVLEFANAEALRLPILRGELPRAATVKLLGASSGGGQATKSAAPAKIRTLEEWAKSNEKLRPLYAPVWAVTLKGAVWGFIVVAILKTLDSTVMFFRINPLVGLLFLWLGALMGSPKWKKQILYAGIFLLFAARNAIDFGALFGVIQSLFGAWFGVFVFAAVFGVGAGMPIGTVTGAIRARRARCAPDRQGEGMKPAIWGFAVPAIAFAGAAIVYWRIVMPYFIKEMSQ
jgi:hypothetical protein